jgi:hypothetical protein
MRDAIVSRILRRLSARACAAAVAAFIAAAPALAGSPSPAEPAPERNCFYQLMEDTGPLIDCEHPAWLTAEEKADLKKMTRDYLLDARCKIAIKIERSKVDAALVGSDLTFESPPQPMTCVLTMSSGDMTIAGTFAPKVVFKDGIAVDASPGLANITGINSYLAWPVVHYINNADRIRAPMKLMINAYRARRGSIAKDKAP